VIKVLGIDHAAINVKDLKASLDFYTNVLGLKITEREPSKPGVEYFLDCGSSLIGLIQADQKDKGHLLQDAGFGGNHVAFRVPAKEFDRVAEELRERGVKVHFSKKRERSW
jgi:catechol 2,3-dioxygenase-like lactoylglutathione lyase family enzyme